MSSQSPNSSSVSTEADAAGKNPAAAFGPNEWLVDEIYQQYLQDPNSVDRAWWDFFADYQPGPAGASPREERAVDTETAAAPSPAEAAAAERAGKPVVGDGAPSQSAAAAPAAPTAAAP
ncbi:2-oxoglutarate dehydrogenase E1 subunit family protein, partial [Streptomyces oceani]